MMRIGQFGPAQIEGPSDVRHAACPLTTPKAATYCSTYDEYGHGREEERAGVPWSHTPRHDSPTPVMISSQSHGSPVLSADMLWRVAQGPGSRTPSHNRPRDIAGSGIAKDRPKKKQAMTKRFA